MNVSLIDALQQIEREKDIPVEVLVETIEAALVSAYKKHFGANGIIRVHLDWDTSDFRVYAEKSVVEKVRNSHLEISLEEARQLQPEAQLGEVLRVEVTPTNFGRIAAQTAKQVILQRIREAEREVIYQEYADQEGEVLTGIVQRIERNVVYVNVGKIEALLPAREQMPGEDYRFGDRLKVYVLRVERGTRLPEIVVSRTHPGLLRRLFEMEVPEIHEGVVELKSIAREPGVRSKVAVASRDPHVDPVGACVGHRGSRVQAITNELGQEKIDIIRWSENPAEYIAEALSPAKISRVVMNPNGLVATVIVPDDQQSLAIGRSGQNVRLAARLTGLKIDIRSETQIAAQGGSAALEKSPGALAK
ncbi:MAG TPA: transcription termination/antitermination protein NusA [Armatimonadetes bacterium]|nr:transcription termination/antitermination protein NusA [Armatimonadota bacterium]